jgi:hypothetical protein
MDENSRSTFVTLLLVLPAIGAMLAVFFGTELQRFLRAVPALNSTADIERLKLVVARQMYAALAQIVILGLPIIIFFAGMKMGYLSPADLVFVIVPSAVILLIAQAYKKVEAAVRTMPAADEQLRRERDRIVHIWLKKPFPDW